MAQLKIGQKNIYTMKYLQPLINKTILSTFFFFGLFSFFFLSLHFLLEQAFLEGMG